MKRLSLFIFIGIILITTTSCVDQKVKSPPKVTPKEVVQEKTQDSGKYISKDIIELVKDCISKDKDLTYLKKYATGRELNSKDIAKLNIQGEDREYLNTVLSDIMNYSFDSKLTLVDFDNDGIDEIAVYEDSGGSAGFVYFTALEKDRSGVYKTSKPIEYQEGDNFGTKSYNYFIKYKEKTYFLDSKYDYNTHVFQGITIYAFAKGKLVERGFVGKFGEELKAQTQFVLNKKYKNLIEKLKLDTPKIIAALDEAEVISGSIEKPVPQKRIPKYEDQLSSNESKWNEVDLDNNGQLDMIGKGLFLPSSVYGTRFLDYVTYINLNDKLKKVDIDQYYKLNEEGLSTEQLWFESYQGKNLMIELLHEYTNNYYYLNTYLFERTKCQKIGQIKIEYKKEVTLNIEPVK